MRARLGPTCKSAKACTPTDAVAAGAEVEIADGTTISKTLHQDEFLKVVLFGFAAGQELSEHTASVPAIIQFLDGEQQLSAKANTFVHMPANMPHSIAATSPTRMLLLMLKVGRLRLSQNDIGRNRERLLNNWLSRRICG